MSVPGLSRNDRVISIRFESRLSANCGGNNNAREKVAHDPVYQLTGDSRTSISHEPYAHLSLVFDADGKLTKMKWSYP